MDANELRSILSIWPTPFHDATIVDRHQGFSGAAVFRIEVQDEHFALRRWPPGAIPTQRLRGLHAFLHFVHARGITQLSVPVRTLHHNTLHLHDGSFWQLEPWMPGIADFRENPTDEKLRSAMQTLARFHRAACEFRADDTQAEWFAVQHAARSPTIEERLGTTEFWLRMDRTAIRSQLEQRQLSDQINSSLLKVLKAFDRHGSSIRDELQSLHSLTYRLQPSLRDIWHDHVLFEGDQVTGLIDPSACLSENPVIDLSRLLVSLDIPKRTQFALEAYEQIRPLTPDEQRLRLVFERSQILLSGLTWIERYIAGKLLPNDYERVQGRLQDIVERLPRLES